MELQHLPEQCQGENWGWIQGIQVVPAAEGLCLWKQLFCVPCYSCSELEEKALTLMLIWFTDWMVCLNIWKSASYNTELNSEWDITYWCWSGQILVGFFSWHRFLTDVVDCKWPFDLNIMKLDIWEPILCIIGEVLLLLRLFSNALLRIVSLLPYYQLGTKGT